MDTEGFISYITGLPSYQGQIVHREDIRPRDASHADLDHPLPPELQAALETRGLFPLFSHQAQAINAVHAGDNVVLSTAAASGKSLAYHIPILQAALTDRTARALYISPTKALAQDQLRSLTSLTDALDQPVPISTYDGDTPGPDRAAVRRDTRVVFTNPDMLHLGILPNHKSWERFLRGLRYVVLDEAHVYRGVFGSHLANIMRRLRRLCRLHGSDPQFVLASATLGNPRQHAEALVGAPVTLIDDDGSPYGGKDFLLWNPPFIDNAKTTRRSTTTEAVGLFSQLVGHGIRTLAFTRTRRLAELAYNYSRDQITQIDPALAKRVSPYRAGYIPEERRQIEADLVSGQLLGVVATNALELGIDIGDLDATILTGFPGSIASTVQQAGRSGRRGDRSVSVLVGLDNPLDQYILRHPETLFGRPHEYALVAPQNPHILAAHLQCAAYEAPLRPSDTAYFGENLAIEAAMLEAQGLLRERRGRWYPTTQNPYPAEAVNIRSSTSDTYEILETETGRVLESVDGSTAYFELFPGAVYLHRGEEYLIEELDTDGHVAYALRTTLPYYTQSADITDLKVLQTIEKKSVGGTTVTLGEVDMTTQVVGYKKKRHITEELIELTYLDLPPVQFPTVAVWWDVPQKVLDEVEELGMDTAGGLHAAEHAAIGLLPLFALCDRQDIGGLSTPHHMDTNAASIFIYDGHPGGIGITERGYEIIEELWRATLEAVRACPCEEGCPSCIQSPKCGNNNEPLDKAAAVFILESLLGGGDKNDDI